MRETRMDRPQVWLRAIFVVLALAAYCAPWLASTGASLSLNGYDLAEWSSLIPGVRYGAQPMLIPGLLRAPLLLAAGMVALLPTRRGSPFWWLCGAAGLALVIALLPPFEYFLQESWRGDVNYGQQVTFALLALIDAAICWLMPRGRPQWIIFSVFAVAGIITSLAGASQAVALAANYSIPASMGMGVAGYATASAGAAMSGLFKQKRQIDFESTEQHSL